MNILAGTALLSSLIMMSVTTAMLCDVIQTSERVLKDNAALNTEVKVLNDMVVSLRQASTESHIAPLIVKQDNSVGSQDYVLDNASWRCSLYGSKFVFSHSTGEKFKQYYIGKQRICVRYEMLRDI